LSLRSAWRRLLLRLLSAYPPFVGAGIRVRRLPGDPQGYEVRMKLRFWNANYHGTHFGGSLYSMCDPFYVLVLAEALGGGYEVWDKMARIRFRRPGRGTVTATFTLPRERVEQIRAEVDATGRLELELTAAVVDERGAVVADIDKVLSVRRKEARAASATAVPA
jgi:acyl-coenzyme A thioesterase PaaI-like protein